MIMQYIFYKPFYAIGTSKPLPRCRNLIAALPLPLSPQEFGFDPAAGGAADRGGGADRP